VRIVSLVPHATEICFALGLGDQVVGVTHECDWPPEAADAAAVTRDLLEPGLSAAEIDAAVREITGKGEAIYQLDEQLLAELEPDLIVTQALCPVCAVSYDDVVSVAERIESKPKVIALDPNTFGETMVDIRTVAQATGCEREALTLIASQRARVDAIEAAVADRPMIGAVAIEWLDPVFIGGHWTPQLIELAGGVDLLGLPGEPSPQSSWEAINEAEPQVIFVMPCGIDAAGALEAAEEHREQLVATGAQRIVAIDGSATFSRPGPRLVDGLEIIAHVLHPDVVPLAPGPALDLLI
jgi:iron complex transport system substrate-binding protein